MLKCNQFMQVSSSGRNLLSMKKPKKHENMDTHFMLLMLPPTLCSHFMQQLA